MESSYHMVVTYYTHEKDFLGVHFGPIREQGNIYLRRLMFGGRLYHMERAEITNYVRLVMVEPPAQPPPCTSMKTALDLGIAGEASSLPT